MSAQSANLSGNQTALERIKPKRVYGALFLRLGLFALVQALIASVYFVSGQANPWDLSIKWWVGVATITNIFVFYLLTRWFKEEGSSYFSTIHFERKYVGKDLLTMLLILLPLGPIGFFPNQLIAQWLFGDADIAFNLLFQPFPVWVVILFMLTFPVSIAFAELPLYFGYIMPRLSKITGKWWLGVLLPAFFLAAQHCTLPLVFDVRFILWRLLMFLPFAVFLGFVIHWRPRLLPYMMVVHALMDLSTCILLLTYAV